MRILVLAQKGDWTACESALKALERSALDDGGSKHPLSGISDNVRSFVYFRVIPKYILPYFLLVALSMFEISHFQRTQKYR